MTNIATRLKRIEDEIGSGDECPHTWQIIHVHQGEAEAGPERCGICGLLKPRIVVNHVRGLKNETERAAE